MPNITRWGKKSEEAHALMEARRHAPDAIIEISAQHPLSEGHFPNVEFQKRLDEGMALREKIQSDVRGAIWLLVLGSRHRIGEVADECSLSSAGREYLEQRGMPSRMILGEETMKTFKGPDNTWPGVYNSADEAYVASTLFKNEDRFGKIFSIVTKAQSFRKKLHYLWNGVSPDMIPVSINEGHHTLVREWMINIPYTLLMDPDWQSPKSKAALRSRLQRQVE